MALYESVQVPDFLLTGGSLPLQIQIPRLEAVALSLGGDSKPPAIVTAPAAVAISATKVSTAAIGGAPARSSGAERDDELVEKKEKRPTETVPGFAPAQTQFTPAEKKAFERAELKAQETCLKLSADEASATGKAKISMVVIGHVDAGKSTITGHLLYRLGYVSQKLMHKYEKESREAGKSSFAYAWVMDADDEEVSSSSACVRAGRCKRVGADSG